jgi:hypothetical protein
MEIIRTRVIYSIIIEKVKTAGPKTCSTDGEAGGGKLKNQLRGTAGGHTPPSRGHV